MNYWLRRVIFEDIWEQQTAELISLCKRADIDGVLLMEQSHMMLMSPYPLEKHRRMAAVYRKIGERIREQGIRFGINIASIVGHTDMDVPEAYRMEFQKFVGSNLKEANACYCILDEKWQAYAAEVCRLYAASNPEYLFIDDDFRSLNHGSTLGCFCPIHAENTAEKVKEAMKTQTFGAEEGISGKTYEESSLTAADILKALQEDSPYARLVRRSWMEANREGQRKAARRIREAVKKENPQVMIGLMSSDEMRHSLQGRKIEELLREFAGEHQEMLYRPTGAIYGDALHRAVFEGHQRMALTMGEIKGRLHTVSELELFPHSRFGCSRRFSEIMLQTQILAGADDITLNLYDYLGNPLKREPVWEEMLSEKKELLKKLAELRKGKRLKGFGLPYRQEEARFKTWNGSDAAMLYADRTLDILLPAMGIPVQFTEGTANAVTGEAVWCYSDEELKRFLSKGFLTDAKGAEILWQRGFGEYLGCYVKKAEKAIPALEKILPGIYAGEFAGDFLPCRWNLFAPEKRYVLEPFTGAEVLTQLLDLEKCPVTLDSTENPGKFQCAAGAVLYRNSLGGSCAVFALAPKPDTWNFRARAWLAGRVIEALSGDELPLLIPDRPNLGPIYYEDEESQKGLLAVINGSLDSYDYKITDAKINLVKRLNGSGEPGRIEGMSMEIWETERKQ